ncbi:hypothetical protein [Exiguobacterium oxidotolerans]|uniref:DUF5666 domain-containing protein n=1 Tax=Exiguobacterium oxidotolerans TaxID=223958 RepID=A0A653I1T1_9BACL|nr:hypothetical protein [Exiguobacterium oxidotolerans]VWX32721.1 conserved hypothetical protein [Exiguobacterium oxidotolerans]
MTNEKRTDQPKKNFVKRGLASIAITGTFLTGAGAFLLFTGPGHALVNSTVTTSEQVEQKVEAASTKVSSNVKQSLPSAFQDDDQEIEGTLKEVSDTSVTLTQNGSDQSYSFASSAEIEQAQAGDWIKIELNQDGLVRELERENDREDDSSDVDRNEVNGVVKELSKKQLVLTQNGSDQTYRFSERAEIDQAQAGDNVKLELTAAGLIRELDREGADDATEDQDIRGALVRVTDTQVVIEQNGKNVTFERAQNMEQDNDVQVGSQVELELNGSKQVTEIDEQS